jgi:hypothetical protein
MKEALSSSETSVLTRATRLNIPEDTILHSHRHENLKSYIAEDAILRFECCTPPSEPFRFYYIRLVTKKIPSIKIGFEDITCRQCLIHITPPHGFLYTFIIYFFVLLFLLLCFCAAVAACEVPNL